MNIVYTSRLAELCKAFGWQGGTIHQANEKAAEVLGLDDFDALNMEHEDFIDALDSIETLIFFSLCD